MKKKLAAWLAVTVVGSLLLSVPVSATMLRPSVVAGATHKGTLKVNGELIRAGVAYYGRSYPDPTALVRSDSYWSRSKNGGLNAIRLTNWDQRSYDNSNPYAEGPGWWPVEDNVDILEEIVQTAADYDMYVIVTPGDEPGSFSKPYLTEFWTEAAPCLANYPNVIFEVTNEPVAWGADDYTNAKMDNLADIYNIMRAGAPDTPILSLTFNSADQTMENKVNYYKNKITGEDFTTKDVIAFHSYGTSNTNKIKQLRAAYPVMNTEWNYLEFHDGATSLDGYKYQGQAFEAIGISSMNFRAGRSDGRFTEYYKYVNDAKYKGYYWVTGTTVTDDLDDLSMTYSSNNVVLNTSNPTFPEDSYRYNRGAGAGTGEIVYESPGFGKFKATVYSSNSFAGIKFYVSHNGTDWEQISHKKTTPQGTTGVWEYAHFSSNEPIPSGTKYFKVVFPSTGNAHQNQLGNLELTTWSYIPEVEDNLNAWSVADSHSANMQFNTANPGNFAGDGSRASRSDTNLGYVVYKLADMGGFWARIFYKDVGGLHVPQGLSFRISTDGTTWSSPIAVTGYQDEATGNGFRSVYMENSNALPAGTEYVKVELDNSSANNSLQLGTMRVFMDY
ncbi:cellulase family glycosylhydrolase [Paenibacillus koleovorans]|uniref:cellulase family glycosylhydrolase n=1 Tax=Paenibacillus koleovorans TaxID=121608 RepID=UPI000FDC5994|nr:cellulase family glycosylhydrolase [Paenibacillus koleovorans]